MRWVPLVAFFRLDGFRDRLPVVVPVAPPLAADDRVVVVAEAGRRADLVGGLGSGWLVRVALVAVNLVASRAGMEERTGRVAVLVVVFKDERLGLVVGPLGESLVAGGLGERAGLEALTWSGLAGDVGVRGCAADFRVVDVDLDADWLGVTLSTWMVDGRLVTVWVFFGDGAAETAEVESLPLRGDAASLAWGFAPFSGEVTCVITVSTMPPGLVSLKVCSLSKPLLVGDDKGLFKGAFRSSELKLLTLDGGAAGLSLRLLALLNPATAPDWVAPSTAMKLARTFDRGLEPECSEPTGDRPREGGDVVFWLLLLLFSNLASKLLTPG